MTLACANADNLSPLGFGQVTEAVIESTAGPVPFLSSGGELSIVADPCGGFYFRQRYVPTPALNTQGSPVVEFRADFSPVNSACLSYWIYVESNNGAFDWGGSSNSSGAPRETGKLHGLCGGSGPTGGNQNTGFNGFSNRIVWDEGGEICAYAYHVDTQTTNGGQAFERYCSGVNLPLDQWVCLKICTTMNTGSNFDGSTQIYLGCDLILDQQGIRWTLNGGQIDCWMYSSFFGGFNTTFDNWAPSTTQFMRFDDFHVSEGSAPQCCNKFAAGAQAALNAAVATCGATSIPKSSLFCRGLTTCSNISTTGAVSATPNFSNFGLDLNVTGPGSVTIADGCDCPTANSITATGNANCNPTSSPGQLVIC